MQIQFIGSPNFTAGRAGNQIKGVIIHWMVGTLASTDKVFQNRERNTSAQYGVEDGTVHQYVKDEDTAYHAGNWNVNLVTIGIEHSADPNRPPSDATYETTAQLIANKAKEHGFALNTQTLRHHYEIVATQCSGPVPGNGVDEARILKRAIEVLGSVPAVPVVAPVPAPATYRGIATVTVDVVMVRSQPSPAADLSGSRQLRRGQTFEFVGAVQGATVNGVSTWLQSTLGNFVWAGATDYPTTPAVNVASAGMASVVRPTNVRVSPNVSAPLGGSKQLQPGQTFNYSALVHGQLVSQNGVTTDIWAHSEAGNYVWWGNCKRV